jgi:ABC-type branched-subunit amino acid transport system substrate-binding protein
VRASAIGALLVALSLATWGAASSTAKPAHATTATAAASGPFKVLGFYPESGPFALPGDEELAGLKAAATVINSNGGILGHKVVLTIKDDQDTGTVAVSEAEQVLASGAKYNLIVPGINGTDAIPLAASLAHTPVLQITPAAESVLNNPSKYPNFFMSLNNFAANEQAVAAALKAKGYTKVAFISGDDSSGQEAGQALAAAAKANGITVTASVLVPDSAVDSKAQWQQALASKPQAIVTGAYTTALGVILAGRAALGNTLPYYLDSFAGSFPLEAVYKTPAQLSNIFVEQFPYLVKGAAEQTRPWFKAFQAAYTKLIPKPVLNLIAGVVSYNALMLARAAAITAGSISGPAMIKAMSKVSTAPQVPGFVGEDSTGIFSKSNHQLGVKPQNYRFYRGGATVEGIFTPGA